MQQLQSRLPPPNEACHNDDKGAAGRTDGMDIDDELDAFDTDGATRQQFFLGYAKTVRSCVVAASADEVGDDNSNDYQSNNRANGGHADEDEEGESGGGSRGTADRVRNGKRQGTRQPVKKHLGQPEDEDEASSFTSFSPQSSGGHNSNHDSSNGSRDGETDVSLGRGDRQTTLPLFDELDTPLEPVTRSKNATEVEAPSPAEERGENNSEAVGGKGEGDGDDSGCQVAPEAQTIPQPQRQRRPVLLEELDAELLEIIKAYYEHKQISVAGSGTRSSASASHGHHTPPDLLPAPAAAPAVAVNATNTTAGVSNKANRLYAILSSSPKPRSATPPMLTRPLPPLSSQFSLSSDHHDGDYYHRASDPRSAVGLLPSAIGAPQQTGAEVGESAAAGERRGGGGGRAEFPIFLSESDGLARAAVAAAAAAARMAEASREMPLRGTDTFYPSSYQQQLQQTAQSPPDGSVGASAMRQRRAGLRAAAVDSPLLEASQSSHFAESNPNDNHNGDSLSDHHHYRQTSHYSADWGGESRTHQHQASASYSGVLPNLDNAASSARHPQQRGDQPDHSTNRPSDGNSVGGRRIIEGFPSYSATSFVRAYVSSDMTLNMEPAVIVSSLAAALNIVVVYFLRNHVLDTRDHLGLFLIGSYLIFASYYMIYYFLERFSSSFRRISSHDKKFYIIGNLLKAGLFISITPFAVYHLIKIIIFDEWEGDILRNLGCIYAIPDFTSMIIVKRMRWSTWVHHALVVLFNYFSVVNDYNEENICRCLVVYAAFSSFSYCVNVLLASRFLGVSVAVARVLSFISLIVYVLCCAVNWAWQVYYLRRLILRGKDHWTVYVYMLLICLVMWDDLVLCRWLLNHARSTAFAATQQLQAIRRQQQQQPTPRGQPRLA